MNSRFNIQQPHALPTQYLSVLNGSENKQGLFPYKTLTDRFSQPRRSALTARITAWIFIQGAYKLPDYFAKPYFHKYWTEIHDVTTIWKRNVCSFIVTLNLFDVRPSCDTADVQAILPFAPNPLKHVMCDVPHCGVDALSQFWCCLWKWWDVNTVLDETPQEEITNCQVWSYGVTKSPDNLNATCT